MSTIGAQSGDRFTSNSDGHGEMSMRSLEPFFAIAFGLAWGLLALMILFTRQIEPLFGPVSGTNPVFILAVYSPGIAAVLLVWWHYGTKGLVRFFRRLTLWRMPFGWWAFLLIGIPAVKCLGAAINGTIGDPLPFSPWYTLLPMLAVSLFIGPLGEEFGWRGVALPLLQRRFAPLWASVILGTIWGVWHLPAFVLGGTPQSAWSFGPYVVGVLALSVIVTPMFNAARGSILIPILFHYQMNLPIWPDAQPWENYLFAGVAVIIVIIERESMLRTGQGVTEILALTARGDDDVARSRRLDEAGSDREEGTLGPVGIASCVGSRPSDFAPSGPCAAPRRLTQAKQTKDEEGNVGHIEQGYHRDTDKYRVRSQQMEEPPIAGRVLKEKPAQHNHRRWAAPSIRRRRTTAQRGPDQANTEDIRGYENPHTSMGTAMNSRHFSMPLKSRSNLGISTSWTH